MRLQEARKDLYRRLAREQGYKSRAAFKLIEANKKYRFIRPGDRVLDLGSAPGGWLQVARELVGPDGLVVGVDVDRVKFKGVPNVVSITADVNDAAIAEKVLDVTGGPVDVILSDLSPKVSGVWEIDQRRQLDLTRRALGLGESLLKKDGTVFCKVFEGEGTPSLRDELRRRFRSVRVVKPAASRNASSELYYCCQGPVAPGG
jgi:23S rRNA (uridine2552-2'-O)-methyltransferase